LLWRYDPRLDDLSLLWDWEYNIPRVIQNFNLGAALQGGPGFNIPE
jgi:hypothetical protein